MKKYIKNKTAALAIAISCLSLFFVACSLDENLYGVAAQDGFVKTEADANYLVNGVYGTLQSYNYYKSCTGNLLLFSGDDFASSNIITNNAGVWLNRGFTSADTYVKTSWNSFFTTINAANSAIETIDPVNEIQASVRSKLNGEMTFLRATSYFNLVRFFGGVPISTVATNANVSFYKQRQPVDSVYKQIFIDLKNANQKCIPFNKQPVSEFGRATKGAAQGMLALAYLTYANFCDLHNKAAEAQVNYQFAADWADSVLLSNQYTLLSNYADLFDVTKEKAAYQEVIYGVQFTRDATTIGAVSKGSEWAYYFQPTTKWNVCGNITPVIYTGGGATQSFIPHNGNGQIFLQPWFVDQYFNSTDINNQDYRFDVSFLTSWDGFTNYLPLTARPYITFPRKATAASPNNLQIVANTYLDKYKDPSGFDSRNNENDFFVMRLAEIYLIKAEALNELGRTSEAYIPFNMLRTRARKANGTARTYPADLATDLDKENFRLAVFNERGLELVGEGQRYFDLIRMRYPNTNITMFQWRLETFYPGLSADKNAMPTWNYGSKTWSNGRVYTPNVHNWDVRYLLYPIPSSESDANPNFANHAFGLEKNNPGW